MPKEEKPQQKDDQVDLQTKKQSLLIQLPKQYSSMLTKLEPKLTPFFSSLMGDIQTAFEELAHQIAYAFEDLALQLNPQSQMESYCSFEESEDGVQKILEKARRGQRSECSFISGHSIDSQRDGKEQEPRKSKSIDFKSKTIGKTAKLTRVKSEGEQVKFDE